MVLEVGSGRDQVCTDDAAVGCRAQQQLRMISVNVALD